MRVHNHITTSICKYTIYYSHNRHPHHTPHSPQIAQVESIVNDRIRSALPVHAQVVPLAAATQIAALRQVFGERYPDPVSEC